MELRNRVGHNIQDLRRARGISQEGLALRAGISRSYMGMIENSRHAASLDKLEMIARVLDVDPSRLLARRDDAGRASGCQWQTPANSESGQRILTEEADPC